MPLQHMMTFSCKQRMYKKANGTIVRWSNRASLHHHAAYHRTIFIALSCQRYRTIALSRNYTIACRTIVTSSSHHPHRTIASLLQRSTLRWCDSELRYPDFIHLGLLYFLEILEIYTYHSYIIYIFCTVTSHAVNTSMYKLSTAYLHKLKLSSFYIEIYLIDVNREKNIIQIKADDNFGQSFNL